MSDKNKMDNMDDLKDQNVFSNVPVTHMQSVPQKAAQEHAKKLMKDGGKSDQPSNGGQEYNLNDDRRIKVLSPGALVAKRFFRNRIAMVGLITLALIFLFSFLGGAIMNIIGYDEKMQFYREDPLYKEYARGKEIPKDVDYYRYDVAPKYI